MKDEALAIINSFETDYPNYTFIEVTQELIQLSKELVSKHGLKGLRTLDSIQLASIIKTGTQLDLAITADDRLKTLIKTEGIKTE